MSRKTISPPLTIGIFAFYLYDAFGAPIGFQHLSEEYGSEWEVYWYEKNLQGDIVF